MYGKLNNLTKGGKMKLNEAIEVLKDLKRLSTIPMTLREGIDTILLNKAIDTVVKEVEKPLLTDDQIKQSITEAVEKEKECIRQFLIDDGYELLADKI